MMSRQLKKYSIKADGKEIMREAQVVVLGFDRESQGVRLNIQGKLSLEEMLDVFNTAQYELLETFFKAASEDPLVDAEKLRRDIHDRAVWGFSLMIDKFDPKAKNDKFAGLTNEAILEAQNRVLKDRIARKE